MSGKQTHGMRGLMARINSERLGKREQRALGRIQHALTAQPLEHLHALVIGHQARWEMLLQGYQAWALANPDKPLPAQAIAVANVWRRTAELLVQIEERMQGGERPHTTCGACGQTFSGDPAAYLRHHCPGRGNAAAPAACSDATTDEGNER
jgi:hypothetical protein